MEEWAVLGFRGAVEEFKRRLIESALRQSGGNRTHAARRLGLQRTYLLRLIRDLGVSAPPSPAFPRPSLVEARASGRPSAPVVAVNGARAPALAKSVDTSRTPGVK